MKSGKNFATLIIVLLLALALPNVISLLRGPAETPDIFRNGYSLQEANAMSQESGKPVLVLATADWCGPCQSLKRGALSDPEVAAIIESNAIPVYLEDGENQDEIRSLGVRAYPSTILLERGQVAGILEGGSTVSGYRRALQRDLFGISE